MKPVYLAQIDCHKKIPGAVDDQILNPDTIPEYLDVSSINHALINLNFSCHMEITLDLLGKTSERNKQA